MYARFQEYLQKELNSLKEQGLYKEERYILTPQGANIRVEYPEGATPKEVLNFCANNYLGLSSHPRVVKAAEEAIKKWGYGMSSVRFICGTQDIHRQLEKKISEFLGTEATILYSSCFDANGGLFEALFNEQDAIISDQLNHASIIDGIRLCKAERFRFTHSDMKELEEILKQTQKYRFRIIATDGVFSMDGDMARLADICELADKYDALVMIDDSHATGFVGKTGRGTPEATGTLGRVDIITTTFGKALGGASGGCTSGRKEIIDMLRQRSRPYLFSNTLSPIIASVTLEIVNMLSETTELRDKLERNTKYFRSEMTRRGFDIKPGDHPICPIMLYDAKLSQDFARDLYYEGIYVIGFFYPVVPKGQARIRVQLSAAHEIEHIDKAIEAFTKVGKKYGVIK
ncbi:MAG: glycine C-acetyltransferase [candidate division WOR-3 bacterium]|nr:glycine C-acetyltransferase [candidate division WOR-3 bacterium]MCX7757666.1 glycine C-acetyltransferase [candidate division WOR-3 bacterium]MDW7987470.1 glycine C-acetyltransferase [candidate division WOR-3 bacterium]